MALKQNESYELPSPMDNDTVIGHKEVMESFMRAWDNRAEHSIHPVWILSGTKGIGKATLAYNIAKQVYGNIGDFFIIDTLRNLDKDRRSKPDVKIISVHTIRGLIDRMRMSSMSGEWRVVIIDSVDELNASASNAMLKLLEEPPAKTLFFLIVHKLANVLPTVRSRARVEKMNPLSISELRDLCVKFLPNHDINTETLELANGSFGKIANLKKNGGEEVYSELIRLLESKNSGTADMMLIAKKIAAAPDLHEIIFDAIVHFKLADLYPEAIKAIADMKRVNLEPETAIFKIINRIKKCL